MLPMLSSEDSRRPGVQRPGARRRPHGYPRCRSAAQARANAAAGAMYDVGTGLATGALDTYDRYFRVAIHPRW